MLTIGPLRVNVQAFVSLWTLKEGKRVYSGPNQDNLSVPSPSELLSSVGGGLFHTSAITLKNAPVAAPSPTEVTPAARFSLSIPAGTCCVKTNWGPTSQPLIFPSCDNPSPDVGLKIPRRLDSLLTIVLGSCTTQGSGSRLLSDAFLKSTLLPGDRGVKER